MRKLFMLMFSAILILSAVAIIKAKLIDSKNKVYKNSEQVSSPMEKQISASIDIQRYALINEFVKIYGRKFELLPDDMELLLYGKWQVSDVDVGHSLKYDISGDALSYVMIEISKDRFDIHYRDENFKETHSHQYENYVFAYYQETLEQMKHDDFLDNYSGVIGLDNDTVGTVIVALEWPSDYQDGYLPITTKFIIIDKYVIAVSQSTFYLMQKVE